MCRNRSLALRLIALGLLVTLSSGVLAQNTAPSSTADLPEPVIQSNHAGEIKALLASPSGELVVSGSVDGTVKLWSQRTGLQLQTISVSPSWVRSLRFSPDSRRLAVGMGDHLVYLYDMPSGTLLRTLRGADSAVVALTFSGDGALLAASTTRDNKVYVWRTDEGRVLATIPRAARALQFMPDTGWLLLTDGTSISEWRIDASGQASALSGTPDSALASAALAPLQSTGSPPTAVGAFGRIIAQARGAVVEWSAIGVPSRYAPISTASLRAVRFSPDDRVMVTTSNTGDVAVWDLESGALSQYLRDAAGATAAFASAVAFSGDGASITAVRGDSRAHWTWQLSSLTPLTLPRRTDIANGFTADYFSEAGADIGKPSPPMPPQLGIVGNAEEFVTTRAILARAGDTAIYAGFTTPTFVRYVTAVNLRTGAAQWLYRVPATQRGRNINAVAAAPDGALVTVAFDDGAVMWLDGASGSLRNADRSPTERAIAVLEYSPGGDLLAGANQLGELVLWRKDGTLLPSPPRRAANVLALAFSQDSRLLATGAVDNTIQLWDIPGARVVRTLAGHTSAVTALGFAHRSDILVSGSEDSTLRVWNARSGELLAAASAVANGDWLTVSPEGFFDGTTGGWNAAPFRFKSAPTTLYRPEQFFKLFYQPGLLAEVVVRQQPVLALLRERRDTRASLDISKLQSSKLPLVVLRTANNARTSNARTVQVAVSVSDGGSGMRDLRIFRNESLVRIVHGPLPSGPGKGGFSTTVDVELTEGPNEISAYAFNNDDVKSEDASVRVLGSSGLKRQGKAYVVAVGVNVYSNPSFNLSYAAPDARLLADRLSASFAETGAYAGVEPVVLTDQEATRHNLLFALQRLAGLQPMPLPSTPKRLLQLPRAHPEDAVVFYYAGHGEASGGNYYLLPHDLPYSGPKAALTKPDLATILSQAISDGDLNEVLEQIDAGKMLLVIDACYSGQVLQSSESRRGPLNARGIAQLAYQKGAYVLAASQSDAEALELTRLAHGVLTYVLIEQGLGRLQADANRDSSVTVGEWFRHAQITVPLELTSLKNERAASGRPLTVGGNELGPQRPQFYFRRETPDGWIVGRRTR